MKDFLARIGTFFFLIGVGLMALFIASDVTARHLPGETVDYGLLCVGVLLISMGFLFRRTAGPPEAADRFRSWRRWKENQKKKREEKAKAQQQKK